MALKPAFQQKRIAACCSTVFPITIYDVDETDKLRYVANMYLTANGSSWNLTCTEKMVYWRTSLSFMEIALLVLCFRSVVEKFTGQILYLHLLTLHCCATHSPLPSNEIKWDQWQCIHNTLTKLLSKFQQCCLFYSEIIQCVTLLLKQLF